MAVVTDGLEQPIKGDIALVARTIRRRWTIKLFTARIAQRVANTGRRVASGRWLLRTAAIAAKTKWLHRYRIFHSASSVNRFNEAILPYMVKRSSFILPFRVKPTKRRSAPMFFPNDLKTPPELAHVHTMFCPRIASRKPTYKMRSQCLDQRRGTNGSTFQK
nr:hypothetical protein [Pseudomonas syringae group genomosp. 3]